MPDCAKKLLILDFNLSFVINCNYWTIINPFVGSFFFFWSKCSEHFCYLRTFANILLFFASWFWHKSVQLNCCQSIVSNTFFFNCFVIFILNFPLRSNFCPPYSTRKIIHLLFDSASSVHSESELHRLRFSDALMREKMDPWRVAHRTLVWKSSTFGRI